MSVKLEVGQPLGNNRVEVNATYNGYQTKKFSVPEDKNDEFVSSYKKLATKVSILSTLGMCITGGLGGIAGGQLAKNASNNWVRWGAVIGGGLVGYISAMFATAPFITNMEKNVLNKFGAEEVNPSS